MQATAKKLNGTEENFKILLSIDELRQDGRAGGGWFRGVVTPISWDQNENPLEFSLLMDDEEEFILKPFKKGFNLRQFTNKRVAVYGEIYGGEFLVFFEVHLDRNKLTKQHTKNQIETFDHEFKLILPQSIKFTHIH